MNNREQIKVAVNCFVIRDNKLLLGKRKNVPGDGYYGLPSGHLEFMESCIEGAKRELKEETGLIAKHIIFKNVTTDPLSDIDGTHYIHFNFLVDDFENEPVNLEPHKCDGWEWFDLASLPEDIFIGHRHSIDHGLLEGNIIFEYVPSRG